MGSRVAEHIEWTGQCMLVLGHSTASKALCPPRRANSALSPPGVLWKRRHHTSTASLCRSAVVGGPRCAGTLACSFGRCAPPPTDFLRREELVPGRGPLSCLSQLAGGHACPCAVGRADERALGPFLVAACSWFHLLSLRRRRCPLQLARWPRRALVGIAFGLLLLDVVDHRWVDPSALAAPGTFRLLVLGYSKTNRRAVSEFHLRSTAWSKRGSYPVFLLELPRRPLSLLARIDSLILWGQAATGFVEQESKDAETDVQDREDPGWQGGTHTWVLGGVCCGVFSPLWPGGAIVPVVVMAWLFGTWGGCSPACWPTH